MGKLGQASAGMPGAAPGRGAGQRIPEWAWAIIVDGWVLPEQPTKIYADGREQKVALMIGNNSQEMQPWGRRRDVVRAISAR